MFRLPARFSGSLREGSWVAGGYAFAAVGSLASVRILTAQLTPIEYGRAALALSVAALLQGVAFLPVVNAATRFYVTGVEDLDFRRYYRACRDLTLLFGLGITALVTAIMVARREQHSLLPLICSTAPYVCFFGMTSVLSAIQTAARQRKVVALHSGAAAWLRLGFAVIAIKLMAPTGAAVMVGFSLTSVLILLSQWRCFASAFHDRLIFDRGQLKECRVNIRVMFTYAWPFASWGLLSWIQSNADRWIIARYLSAREVGFYQVVYQLGYQPMFLWLGFLLQLVTPVIFQRAGDGADASRVRAGLTLTRYALIGTLLLTALAVSGSALFHIQILRLFAAPQYISASPILVPLVAASGISAASQVVGVVKMTEFKSRELMIAQAVPAFLGTLGIAIACRSYGLYGVAVANALSATLSLAILLSISRTAIRSSQPLSVSA